MAIDHQSPIPPQRRPIARAGGSGARNPRPGFAQPPQISSRIQRGIPQLRFAARIPTRFRMPCTPPMWFSSATTMRCPPRSAMPRRLIEQRRWPGTVRWCSASKPFSPATSTFSTNGGAAKLTNAELRQRIRFDLDWGYDWTPFHELLVTARDHAEGRLRPRLHAARRSAQDRRPRSSRRRQDRRNPASAIPTP